MKFTFYVSKTTNAIFMKLGHIINKMLRDISVYRTSILDYGKSGDFATNWHYVAEIASK